MTAALLGWPQCTFAAGVTIEGKTAIIDRETDAGTEKIKVPLPAVITADLRLNDPRYATLPNIMKAKKKPLDVLQADALGIDIKVGTSSIRDLQCIRTNERTNELTLSNSLRLRSRATP